MYALIDRTRAPVICRFRNENYITQAVKQKEKHLRLTVPGADLRNGLALVFATFSFKLL